MSIGVNHERRDLTETVQFPVRVGCNLIVPRVCAVQLDVRIVDPVVLLRSANDLFITDALDVRALERCVIARLERDLITGDDTARRSNIKADLRRRDNRRTVVDLRDLCKRTRKILRRDRSLRRKVHAGFCVDRRRAVREVVILPGIARDLYIIRDILRRNIAAAARDVLVCIAARDGHHGVIVHLRAVLRANELVVIRRPRRIDDVRLRIRIDECTVM